MICAVCKIDKPTGEFHKRNAACKLCRKTINARSYQKRKKEGKFSTVEAKVRLKETSRKSYQKHIVERRAKNRIRNAKRKVQYNKTRRDRYRENPAFYIAQSRQFRLRHPDRARAINTANHAKRMATDPLYRLESRLRCRINMAIRTDAKAGSAVRDLGCTIRALKKYIESLWLPGMSWTNWTRHGWHIDHICPLSSFDLIDPKQFKRAVHYTNLQPLWAEDNLKKGSKI